MHEIHEAHRPRLDPTEIHDDEGLSPVLGLAIAGAASLTVLTAIAFALELLGLAVVVTLLAAAGGFALMVWGLEHQA